LGRSAGAVNSWVIPGGVDAGQHGEHSNIHTSAIKAAVTSGREAAQSIRRRRHGKR
jgi:hypothetical protein